VKLFREEFERHVLEGRCPADDHEDMLVGAHVGRSVAKIGVGQGEAGVHPQPSSGIAVDGAPPPAVAAPPAVRFEPAPAPTPAKAEPEPAPTRAATQPAEAVPEKHEMRPLHAPQSRIDDDEPEGK
jgi:hypothetical protein